MKKDLSILFLDIDGVLATPKSYKTDCFVGEKQYNSFCPKAVANLNMVLRATDAKMVISSTWRRLYTFPELKEILKREGVEGEVVGVTPSDIKYGSTRGIEIQAWLDDFPAVKRFVILDDDVQDIKDIHPGNLVYIMGGWSGGHGMLKEHARQAIEILNGGPNTPENFASVK